MTPLTWQLVKSVAIVAGAWIVLRRFSFREFPALITWMLWEVAMQSATLGLRDLPRILIIVQDGVCAAAICEVIRLSRLDVRLDVQIRALLCVLASAKILASIPDLTGLQEWYLFRCYFLMGAFAILLAITVQRWRAPILERRATQVYRLGATAWVFVLAFAGSFVKGGIGYMLFPRTLHTWSVVHVVTCVAIAIVVTTMSAAMAASAPGRKHAAKTPQGMTRTGLLEMENVA